MIVLNPAYFIYSTLQVNLPLYRCVRVLYGILYRINSLAFHMLWLCLTYAAFTFLTASCTCTQPTMTLTPPPLRANPSAP